MKFIMFGNLCATVFICFSSVAGGADTTWLTTGPLPVSKPAFIMGPSVKGENFEDKFILSDNYIDLSDLPPVKGDQISWSDKQPRTWIESNADTSGFMFITPAGGEEYQLAYHAIYISSGGLYEFNLEVESPQMFEIWLDGNRMASSYKTAEEGKTNSKTATLRLDRGKFLVVVKSLFVPGEKNSWKIRACFTGEEGMVPVLCNNPLCTMSIHHLLEGTKLGQVSLSADGTLIMVSYSRINTKTGENNSWTEIKDIRSGKILQSFRKESTTGYRWMPSGAKMYYTQNDEHGSTVWVYDFAKGQEYAVMRNVTNLSGVQWSALEDFIIYGVYEEGTNKAESSLKYMDELGNRTFRTERGLSLYRYDIASGVSTRLSFSREAVNLEDISRDGNYILFSLSESTDTIPPFSLQSMYRMDLETGGVDTIWKDTPNSGSPQFSPDGSKLLITGGPDCFDGIGKNMGDQPVANSSDQQLFIFDLATRTVDPVTRDFNPSIETALWHPVSQKIYITANDQMYTRAFEYDTRSRIFKQLNTIPEVITSFSVSGNSLKAAYVGNNLASPPRAWILDLSNGQSTLFDQTESQVYRHVTFGKSEEWNFVISDGTTIRGYFIHPVNFDPAKKYPLIVNYYGGVSPIEKSFGGRYPQDIWAGEGYVVYVPQPSGAIGFGQEFSARHQNNWGATVADEIIEGTKKFIASHSFVDPGRVGCIGASYGGFMTMLLQTKTDMFACAISHAGISSISSYWGEGYWGYWYNTVASLGSYPWNRKDLYVGQSPLFSADKINTPLLLLHGSSDVNVPLGESLQLWVGLKILGKPVEMVQVEGEDHHILTYSKRIEWHNTIMAWFDKWLKGNGHDWEKLFPESRL